MSRKLSLATSIAALLLLLGSDGARADAPFGFFAGIPGGDNAGTGVIPLTGWALATSGVNSVDIVVDGGIVDRAAYGRRRPGVAVQFPGFPDSSAAGFAFELDTTHFPNGVHSVSARVQSRAGQVVYLGARDIMFNNVTADLIPFGRIEFPNPSAELFGLCDLTSSNRRYSIVQGYALDPGVQQVDTGIGYVELLIDRSLFFSSQRDCGFLATAGGLSNCYGLRRLDIAHQFSSVKDSTHSGFRFALDVGVLLATKDEFGHLQAPLYLPGSHVLTIRAGDLAGELEDVAEIPVTFTCSDFTHNEDSIGQIELPAAGLLYSGTILMRGWAVDFEGVQKVFVLVDGEPVGLVNMGVPRPDIASLYPSYPLSPGPGWFFSLDTTQFSNGDHQLSTLVVDSTGATTDVGNLRVTFANVIP